MPPWRSRNRARLVPARKQRSWESTLVATGRPAPAAISRTSRLAQLAQREAHPRQRLGLERRQHVGLVLGLVGGGAQQRPARVVGLRGARVVAGGQRRAAEAVGELEHRVEPHVAVAAHARVGRLPRRVAGDERVHDPGAELARAGRCVKCGMPIGCASARAWATAVAEQQLLSASFSASAHSSSVTATVVPVCAHRCAATRCRRRRSWPPACAGLCGTARMRASAETAPPSARASASAASSAAWSLPGLSPPSSSAISCGADARGVEERGAADQASRPRWRRRSRRRSRWR